MAEPFLTPVEVENLRQPFRRVLRKYQLRPLEVDQNHARFHIHEWGSFWCSSESCGNQWKSNFSWLTFDLRELTVKKKWAMKCRLCLSLCYPDFEIDQMVEMFEIAVQLWKLLQQQRDRFWSQWSKSYLHELQSRSKWTKRNPNIKEGQLVLMKEPGKPPMKWSLARILNVYAGQDGLVRVIDVRTPAGVLRRPITQICPLPDQERWTSCPTRGSMFGPNQCCREFPPPSIPATAGVTSSQTSARSGAA